MKKCSYCGLENTDEAVMCATCHTEFVTLKPAPPPLSAAPQADCTISPQEMSFWGRMTFRQFAVLMIRLEAIWFFFYAVLDATYLPRYVIDLPLFFSGTRASMTYQLDFILLIVRIGMHVIAGFLLIFNADKLLSWMVRDLVHQPAPLNPLPPRN